jgi:hypothetical protein
VRKAGAGRKKLREKDVGLVAALEELVGACSNAGREWRPQVFIKQKILKSNLTNFL